MHLGVFVPRQLLYTNSFAFKRNRRRLVVVYLSFGNDSKSYFRFHVRQLFMIDKEGKADDWRIGELFFVLRPGMDIRGPV